MKDPNDENIKAYFKNYFNVYTASNIDGSETGMITGYYQPILKGSKSKTSRYKVPLYTTPKDLITVTSAAMIRIKTGTLISVGINFLMGDTEAFDSALPLRCQKY